MNHTTHIVDGSLGEGGGQVLRSSLSLSAITGQAIEIRNIRSRRSPPGLRPQHLAAARAAAEICDAELEGDQVGSQLLRMTPGPVKAGEYRFDVGTAGSTMLVLQTVLPPLLGADGSSRIELLGGTHNPLAPPIEFLQRVYLPTLRRMGASASCHLERRGFYPRGGGRVTAAIEPCRLHPLRLAERGRLNRRRVTSVCAGLPKHIGQREVDVIIRQLGWRQREGLIVLDEESLSPGNVALVEMEFEHAVEMISEHGRVGLPAEKVAKRAARSAQQFLDADVPVGEHLADQLLLLMGIAAWRGDGASTIRTLPLTRHSSTQVLLLRQLLGVQVHVDEEPHAAEVRVEGTAVS